MSRNLSGREVAGVLVFTAIAIAIMAIIQFSGKEEKRPPPKLSDQVWQDNKKPKPKPKLSIPRPQKEFATNIQKWLNDHKAVVAKFNKTGNEIPYKKFERKFKAFKRKLRKPGVKVSGWVCIVSFIKNTRHLSCEQGKLKFNLWSGRPQKLYEDLAIGDSIKFSGRIVGHEKDLKAFSEGVPSDTLGYSRDPFGHIDKGFDFYWVQPYDVEDIFKFRVKVTRVKRAKTAK